MKNTFDPLLSESPGPVDIQKKLSCRMGFTVRRVVVLAMIASLVFSSGIGDAAAFVIKERQGTERLKKAFEESVIPYSAGRITDARYFGSSTVVIAIQDLHCHSEVQKNIAGILSILAEKYPINAVYQEGAWGAVDTSWLSGKNEPLGNGIAETLLERGVLNGAEYYSILSKKPNLIRGLENETLYKDNILRLNRIYAAQNSVRDVLSNMKDSLEELKRTYYGPKNQRLERTASQYRSGAINVKKYYGILKKYGQKTGLDVYSYENLAGYLDTLELERDINYSKVARELQRYALTSNGNCCTLNTVSSRNAQIISRILMRSMV